MPTTRYDMPAVFGPSLMPDQTHVPLAEVVAVSFETSKDAAAKLLPRFFELGDKATVSISRIDYQDVDYLGGRGYREVVVSVNAVYHGPSGAVNAGYAPVLWVSETGALIGGREYMGLAKLAGEMDDIDRDEGRRVFRCAEYGTTLLECQASGLRPLSDDAMARVRKGSAEVQSFGWKYIPSAEGKPDADYPLLNVMRWDYARAWSGESQVRICRPDQRAAPMSSRVMAALDALPVKEYRRAFVGEGSAIIDRAATRRLDVPAA